MTEPMNQCDGCAAGIPVDERGCHRMGRVDGYADLMACQRDRYTAGPRPELPKSCTSCGRVFRTREEWERLEFVGIQGEPRDAILLSLRNCYCGSTIAICIRGRDELDRMMREDGIEPNKEARTE